MKHTDKIKLARKLRSNIEIKLGVPLFDNKNWQARKEAKLTKQLSAYMKVLGQKGGNILKASKPPDYYQKISAMGNAKKAELKKLRDEANSIAKTYD